MYSSVCKECGLYFNLQIWYFLRRGQSNLGLMPLLLVRMCGSAPPKANLKVAISEEYPWRNRISNLFLLAFARVIDEGGSLSQGIQFSGDTPMSPVIRYPHLHDLINKQSAVRDL